jgi:hypothetical protein
MEMTNMNSLRPGMVVVIKHDQGLEIGEIYSVNPKAGKVLVFFNYAACPHYASFNISQIMSSKMPKC